MQYKHKGNRGLSLITPTGPALLDGEDRFFGLHAPGLMLEGCAMHQRLLAAYDKVHRRG